MKKFILIPLAFFYLIATSGIVISTHYCMGEVAGFALGLSEKDQCDTCGMDNEGCCHDELSIHQLKTDHQSASVSFNFTAQAIPKPIWNQEYVVPIPRNISFFYAFNKPPLSYSNHQSWLCVFRI